MNNEDEENYLYGKAEREEDQPIDRLPAEQGKEKQDKLNDEKSRDRGWQRFTRSFDLIYHCLGVLVLIYILESLFKLLPGWKSDGTANSIIEIVKTLLFTLSGYLFAKKSDEE